MMSKRKKKWWEELRKNPYKFKKVITNMGLSSKGRGKGLLGPKSYGWRGGRYTTKRDKYVYIYCPDHPFAKRGGQGGGGYVLEHRLVMEKHIGRYLTKKEDIHHVNGKKDDNRIKNLMLVSHQKHYKKVICPKCKFKFYFQ